MNPITRVKAVLKAEPIAVVASVAAVYHQGVAAALAFGLVHWTAVQVTSAEAFVVAALAVPVTIFVRNRVAPV